MSSDSTADSFESPTPAGNLRIGGGTRGIAIEFLFDGRAVSAFAGESVACALFGAGVRTLRRSPRTGLARGMFCLMGSCQECVVFVDGRRLPACQVPARAGMNVTSGEPDAAP